MIEIKNFALMKYKDSFMKMQNFTNSRTNQTYDEIWFLQHFPIFTQGQAGKSTHILQKTSIPIFQSNRGGQVTYHGPGQLIVYFLIDLKRKGMKIKQLITLMEDSIIQLLQKNNIIAYAKKDAPGVYVKENKIASLGLKIIKGYSMHGLSLNVDMDLTPFNFINPCGYQNLKMINIKDLNIKVNFQQVKTDLEKIIIENLNNFQKIK